MFRTLLATLALGGLFAGLTLCVVGCARPWPFAQDNANSGGPVNEGEICSASKRRRHTCQSMISTRSSRSSWHRQGTPYLAQVSSPGGVQDW